MKTNKRFQANTLHLAGLHRIRFIFLSLALTGSLSAQISQSEYTALLPEFTGLHGTSFFPVSGKTLDDVESTFGPRFQISTQAYDFHRGIDVDGVQGNDILAIADGVFWEYREFQAGGFTVILRHDFTNPVTLNGNAYDHYFTYYMHLYDTGTQSVINGWLDEKNNSGNGQVVSAGQHIGEMGNSGSSGGAAYADHLHMEVRVGTTNSLKFQTDTPGSTQHGFDPHLHPLLFFEEPTFGGPDYDPSLSTGSALAPNVDVTITYESEDDNPLLNRVEVAIVAIDDDSVVQSHALDFNLREGYDATHIDDRVIALPYIDPAGFGDDAEVFLTNIVVPEEWLDGYTDGSYRLEISAADIWGNTLDLTVNTVPEPATYASWLGLMLAAWVGFRRRTALRKTLASR